MEILLLHTEFSTFSMQVQVERLNAAPEGRGDGEANQKGR
jgi:hypothetical protein